MPASAIAYAEVDPANSGTVEGSIFFNGTPPPRIPIAMSLDPGCHSDQPNLSEIYVVAHGKMANVFISIDAGLEGKVYRPPARAVVLDQKGCRYVPHVIGVMAGQPVEFDTGDSTMHNIYVRPVRPGNSGMNASQPAKGLPIRHTFRAPEKMMAVRCNLHPWMQAYINVAGNPFYAVSGQDGHYEILGVPPGTYTLAADQEILGEQHQTITVHAGQTTKANFTYTAR